MIRDFTANVITKLQAEGLTVYDLGRVPNLAPYPYVVVYTWRRAGGDNNRRISDDISGKGWRVETMHFGDDALEARWAEEKVEAALEGVRVLVDGVESTPLHLETATGVLADTGVENLFTGASTWTCVSTLQPV